MLAHGVAIGTLHDLVRNGLATAERRTVRAGRRLMFAIVVNISVLDVQFAPADLFCRSQFCCAPTR
jgi:hypothetical protein